MSDIARLKQFTLAWQGVGATMLATAPFTRIERAYSESHRFYHTLKHIDSCLAWLDGCRSLAERPHEVALATWYHDIVYDPLRRDNELASARIARQELEAAAVAEPVVKRIEALIAATAGHNAKTGDAALLVDIDLAILGASEEEFARFEQEVRQEYCMFDEPTYARGRARVLENLLAREPLYAIPTIAGELTDSARANLKRAVRHWKIAGSGPSGASR